MDSTLLLALGVGLLFVIAIVAVVANRRRWQRRAEEWAAAAAQLGLVVRPEIEGLEHLGHLSFFQKGHSRRIRNLIQGSAWGPEAWLGDFEWVTGSGKNRHRHRTSFCALRDPALALPRFELRPESSLLDAIAGLFGAPDIDFEEDPAFSKAYRLTGAEPTAVRARFDPSVRSQLLQQPSPVPYLEGAGDTLLFQPGRLVEPAAAHQLLQKTQELRAIFRP